MSTVSVISTSCRAEMPEAASAFVTSVMKRGWVWAAQRVLPPCDRGMGVITSDLTQERQRTCLIWAGPLDTVTYSGTGGGFQKSAGALTCSATPESAYNPRCDAEIWSELRIIAIACLRSSATRRWRSRPATNGWRQAV